MSSEKFRMLVVDDNMSIHYDFKRVFDPVNQANSDAVDVVAARLFGEQVGEPNHVDFEVDFAFQGEEAMDLVRRAVAEHRPYALAFMDVRMPPGWDGIETVGQLWKVQPDLQVVICTAYADYNLQEIMAKLCSPEKFVILKKPFDIIEIQQLANAFAQKWKLLREQEKRIEQLQGSEQRYRLLVEGLPGIVWTAKADGSMDYINERFADEAGKPFRESFGSGWQQAVHPDDLPRILELWNRSVRTGEYCQAELRLGLGDSTGRVYHRHVMRAAPIRNEGGDIVRWVGIWLDIDGPKGAGELLLPDQSELAER